jgi:hypothetical protein
MADIVPVPKQNPVKDVNKHLRPISLTPTLSKIAEEFVVELHVKPAVLKEIETNQFGCVPKSSTTQALDHQYAAHVDYPYGRKWCNRTRRSFRLQKSFRLDRSLHLGQ